MQSQYIDHLWMLAAQPSDNVEDWQISFTGSVMFQTLPSTYPDVPFSANNLRERIHKSCLADTRFSRDENELTLSSAHLLKAPSQPGQGIITTNNLQRSIIIPQR